MIAAQEFELAEEALKKSNKLRFRALGSSMFPIIRSGDLVTIKPFETTNLVLGDIILFKNNDKFFLHRIIKKINSNNSLIFITKGDFLSSSDPYIDSEQVLGKLITLERDKRVINFNSHWMVKQGSFHVLTQSLLYPILRVLVETLSLSLKIKRKLTNNFKNIFYKWVSSQNI